MISQYRLFNKANGFNSDLYTFPISGKIVAREWLNFMDDELPSLPPIHNDLRELLESLDYSFEQNVQYDAIELDIDESHMEW